MHFSDLSKSGQMRRLRRMVPVALSQYPLETKNIASLKYSHNALFHVWARYGNEPQVSHFVLRISRPGYHSAEELASELDWLTALQANSFLMVPQPMATLTGDQIALANVPGVPETRACVLFRWIDGKLRRTHPRTCHIKRVGQAMAHLHNHAANWSFPIGFTRRRWDLAGLCGASLGFNYLEVRARIPSRDLAILDLARERAASAFLQIGEAPTNFGLIHADLHFGHNVIFHKNNLQLIDFDDCGFGPLLYDIAVACHPLRRFAEYPSLLNTLLLGYQSIRPLPPHTEKLLSTLINARQMGLLLWMFANANDFAFSRWLPQTMTRDMHHLRIWLAEERHT